ncbi:MBL fold metallo-hydrolase [Paenibacillus albiflavus]|uniref:MBL fold metallo-hydrolase n=1 Tax=Paenibacillus albiflavus TaxID=2545760 RepID=A0A4V2WPM5_9BACL|nr:ComEC/Rec2 family competence protein [Paenibacillus albiflavus]TCZ79942.1 MBL fold metallo-hydrolase [Paenibacillus albiflavus]
MKIKYISKLFMTLVIILGIVGCSSLLDVKDTSSTQGKKIDTAGKLAVHFLDVGQGSSEFLISPTGKVMLIDTGDIDKEAIMMKHLKDYQINRIDILVLTHAHADHIGTASAIINNFDVGKIYMPKVGNTTKTYETLLKTIQNKKLKVTTAKAGIKLDWDEQVQVEMVAPVKANYEDLNDTSAVLKVTYGENSFLFTGDAERESEKDMLNLKADLSANVLAVGHHGSNTSSTNAFLDKVKPTYAVIQVGADNKYGHPTDATLNRLSKKNIKVFRNDLNGTVSAVADGKRIEFSTER